jgi:hypothetical protein
MLWIPFLSIRMQLKSNLITIPACQQCERKVRLPVVSEPGPGSR